MPKSKTYLVDNTSKSDIQWSSKNDGKHIYVDDKDILVVTDSVGNKTYSIRMYVPETPFNVFYNIVIKQSSDGNYSNMVLRYETDKNYFEKYTSQDRRKAPFKGTVESHRLSDFGLQSLATSKSGAKKPCDTATVDSSQGSNNSGNSGGGGGNNSSGTSGSYSSYSTVSSGSIGGNSTKRTTGGYVEVGRGHFGQAEGGGDQRKSYAPKKDDCPKVKTLVPINEEEEHVHLEDELNNPCMKDILAKLQQKDLQKLTVPDIGGLSGTGHLAQGILNLFDKSGDYNLTFEVGQLGTNTSGYQINGQTSPDNSTSWRITLDSDLVNNGTKLSIAKTIIHESTHAFILYTLGSKRSSDLVSDLNELHKTRYKANLTQHEFMSQYVDALAHSLAVWDNHSQPLNYYKMLSWGGLETSDAYKVLNNKTNIQNAIKNERFSSSGSKGTKCK